MAKKDEVKIVSLDVSSTCTGYSKFLMDSKKKSYKHISTGSIRPPAKDLIYKRFDKILTHFETENLYEWCDIVIFENYAFGGNRVTQLAELNGVIKYNYYINGKEIHVIAPSSIKKLITGNGRAKKSEVRDALLQLEGFSNLEFKNEDESDSFAVGVSYMLKQFNED